MNKLFCIIHINLDFIQKIRNENKKKLLIFIKGF